MIGYFAGLCLWAGTALLLGGCYNAEDSWKICCRLHIVGDETSSPLARRTIIDWQRQTQFDGTGGSYELVDSPRSPHHSWKKQQIEVGISDFLAGNPRAPASDYFLILGMACRPATTRKDDATRCDIELPIWVECASLNQFFPGGAPVPEELRKPIPALLRVTVDVSASTFLDTSARIAPLPGGRLCHR